jgi:hypothetical protein
MILEGEGREKVPRLLQKNVDFSFNSRSISRLFVESASKSRFVMTKNWKQITGRIKCKFKKYIYFFRPSLRTFKV